MFVKSIKHALCETEINEAALKNMYVSSLQILEPHTLWTPYSKSIPISNFQLFPAELVMGSSQ